MKGVEIRRAFLDFFSTRGHAVVRSSSTVPENDPTILFTNAGMNQFKECFLGTEKREYSRAVSAQKCVRISGKHNDFENVGVTARHHTFFEMLGNFSFGDYFKEDAIKFAWEFVTQRLGLSRDKLWVTVFREDDEAGRLWRELTSVLPDRVVKMDEADNFWMMGETGPCGPCSEIYYYVGPDSVPQSEAAFRRDDGTYVEIWNLVFMQFDRSADGKLLALPRPSIDTGSGLERLAMVMQGVAGTYETDLVRDVIKVGEQLSGYSYQPGSYSIKSLKDDIDYARNVALRVLGDHSRAAAFLIGDGVFPGSDGRGYALRRIIRRALRHGRVLGFKEPFLFHATDRVVDLFGEDYPELVAARDTIKSIVKNEEIKFQETLDGGLDVLHKAVDKLPAGAKLSGKTAFLLHDTFGFPLDLTEDALKPFNIGVDTAEFHAAMEEQRSRSREDRKSRKIAFSGRGVDIPATEFLGYQQLSHEDSVLLISNQGDDTLAVFTEKTPFYGESGGQVADGGTLTIAGVVYPVEDVQKLPGGQFAHLVRAVNDGRPPIKVGDPVRLQVDSDLRSATAANHSATHMLHAALRTVLGDHVHQAGSLVDAEKLRFDFTHFSALTEEQLNRISDYMNNYIRGNHEVSTRVLPIEEARKLGAIALFGEKYGDVVRVVTMGSNSTEFCGGTHVVRTGDVGSIIVIGESAVSSGVRRIECCAAGGAVKALRRLQSTTQALMEMVTADEASLVPRLQSILDREKALEKTIAQLKSRLGTLTAERILQDVRRSNLGVPYLTSVMAGVDADGAKEIIDAARVRLGSGVVALGISTDRGGMIVAGATADISKKFHVGNALKQAIIVAGGKGGGRPDFAQAGGLDESKLDQALSLFAESIP